MQGAQAKLLYIVSEQEYFLNSMAGRAGLPGSAVECSSNNNSSKWSTVDFGF